MMEGQANEGESEVREFVGRDHVDRLRRHFVGLYAGGDGKQFFLSGFILKAGNVWFWCSAGHCVKEIRDLLGSPDADINLNPLTERSGLRIPFAPRTELMQYFDDGMVDFGFIELDEFYVRNLSVDHVVPLEVDDVRWTTRKGGGFILMGVPGESVKLGELKELGREFQFTPIAMHLERLEDGDDEGLPYMNFRFDKTKYIVGSDSLDSVKGLSGSPIFAWCEDSAGGTVYVPVAIQFGWNTKDVIRATPMVLLSGIIKKSLAENDSSFEGLADAD